MKNVPVSVVITCYNLGKYITEAIDSVLAQTFQNFEIIIIDDGSDDKSTVETLDKISHEKIKLIRTANQGVSKARNTAIHLAKGTFICCLDADDKLHREYLEKTVHVLVGDTQKKLGFVTTWAQLFGERTEVWKTLGYNPETLGSINIIHCASLFRKEAWEKTGGYSEDLDNYEDWNFWIGVAEKGYKWELIPEVLFYYRVRPGSKVSYSHKMHDIAYKKIIAKHKFFFREYRSAILAQKESELLQKENNIKYLHELTVCKDKELVQKDKNINYLNEAIALKELEIARHYEENVKLVQLIIRQYREIAKLHRLSLRQDRELRQIHSWLFWRLRKYCSAGVRFLIRCHNLLTMRSWKILYRLTGDNHWYSIQPPRAAQSTVPQVEKLVSVIIPVHDRTVELIESIESILNQTYQNFELIIVTDGSPRGTINVVENYRNHPKVKIFHYFDTSGNAVRGRNKGIREARGAFVAFHDSDDVADPHRLQKSVEYITRFNADIVYGGWRAIVDGTRTDTGLVNGQEVFSPECNLDILIRTNALCQSTVMARRSALIDVGGLKPKMRYREDHELWLRLAFFGYRFKAIPAVLTNLRIHKNNNELNFKAEDDKWYKLAMEEYRLKTHLPPKIAYITPGTGISGGIAIILEHTNRLLSKGFDAFVIAQDNKEKIDWFPNNRVAIVAENTKSKYLLEEIDILIATGWTTISILSSLNAKRKVYFVQSDERRFFEDRETKIRIHDTYKTHCEYMTEALWIQRWLKEEFGHDAYYVPNGLDLTKFSPTDPLLPKGKKPHVLLEGPISIPFKGMDDAYNAVKDLECDIWIISSCGTPKPGWRCNKFFEAVPMSEIKAIYSSCDVFLKMSKVEGFFCPPMEAMACGCAVVVGKVTGYDEYIRNEDNALVVEQGDVAGAKRAVQRLIEDAELRAQLTKNGFSTSREWDWEKSIAQLEKVIDKKPIEIYYDAKYPERYDFQIELKKIQNLPRITSGEKNK